MSRQCLLGEDPVRSFPPGAGASKQLCEALHNRRCVQLACCKVEIDLVTTQNKDGLRAIELQRVAREVMLHEHSRSCKKRVVSRTRRVFLFYMEVQQGLPVPQSLSPLLVRTRRSPQYYFSHELVYCHACRQFGMILIMYGQFPTRAQVTSWICTPVNTCCCTSQKKLGCRASAAYNIVS